MVALNFEIISNDQWKRTHGYIGTFNFNCFYIKSQERIVFSSLRILFLGNWLIQGYSKFRYISIWYTFSELLKFHNKCRNNPLFFISGLFFILHAFQFVRNICIIQCSALRIKTNSTHLHIISVNQNQKMEMRRIFGERICLHRRWNSYKFCITQMLTQVHFTKYNFQLRFPQKESKFSVALKMCLLHWHLVSYL